MVLGIWPSEGGEVLVCECSLPRGVCLHPQGAPAADWRLVASTGTFSSFRGEYTGLRKQDPRVGCWLSATGGPWGTLVTVCFNKLSPQWDSTRQKRSRRHYRGIHIRLLYVPRTCPATLITWYKQVLTVMPMHSSALKQPFQLWSTRWCCLGWVEREICIFVLELER